MKNKKGELTTQQIVMLIVLIVSFAIILFFLFRLNLGKTTEDEVCHNSVVMKGNTALPEETVALNCKTSYVCLTKDGTCESMTQPEIEKVKDKDEVYEVLANEMADCWWMFGEGKINYVGKKLTQRLHCSLCSQIAFDDSIDEDFFENREINQREFYDYMANNNVSGKEINYLEYLQEIEQVSVIEQTLAEEGSEFGKIDLDNRYYVMMGVYNDVSVSNWVVVGTVIAGGTAGIIAAIVASPATGFTSLGAIPSIIFAVSSATAGGIGGGYVGTTRKGESGNEYLRPTLVEVNSDVFKTFNCADIQTLA